MAQPDTTPVDKARLIKPWIGNPPPVSPPDIDGYRLLAREKFDMVRGSIVGMAFIPFWWVLYSVAVGLLGGSYVTEFTVTLTSMLVAGLIALVAVPLLHEAVHGLAAMLVGVRPSYGVGPGFAYTTVKEPLDKRAYLVIAIAPLLVLSAIGLPLATVWDTGAGAILFFLIVNASGAVGDLWMSWRVAFQPRDALFFDLADGFAVLIPEGSLPRTATPESGDRHTEP